MSIMIVVLICLALNALIAAFEMAFVSASRAELKRLAKGGNRDAERLLALRDSPERALSVLQIGITLVGIVSAAVSGAGAADSLEPALMARFGLTEHVAQFLSIVLIVLPLTYLNVVVGELVPKTLALRNPTKMVLRGARWLFIADRFFAPLVTGLEQSTKTFVKIFFPRARQQVADHSANETSIAIDSLKQHHQQAILNLANIERKPVREVMVPWANVNAVASTLTLEEVAQIVLTSGHTRLPVIDEGRVIGVLHTKEFMAFRETGERAWTMILRPILRLREQESALSTLRLMQEKRSHMAVVVNAEGRVLGIVTMEDINEEIWGDIYDEDDDGRMKKLLATRIRNRSLVRGDF